MPTFRVFDIEAIPSTQDLLNEFVVNVVITTPSLTDVAIGSKLWGIGYTLARQQSSIYYTLHFYRKQSFVLTASGRYLDLHGAEVSTFRHQENAARGIVAFGRTSPTPYDIMIPRGTVITTPIISTNVDPIKFATLEDVILPAGEMSISVEIVATSPGVAGNLPAGAISRMETPVPGIQTISATSTSGGTVMESDNDFRDRILGAWAGRSTGTTNAIRAAVLSVQGIRSVLIVDPARTRTQQHLTVQSYGGKDQVMLETKDPWRSKYDLYATLEPGEAGLTLKIEQVDEIGAVVGEELATGITSGIDIVDKVNYWSKSGTIIIPSISLDSNPYDDPYSIATDNKVIYLETLSEESSRENVSIFIRNQPNSEIGAKRVTISTYRQYRVNSILGQTEVTPWTETYEDILTYSGLVQRVNTESEIVQMELLDIKEATETLTPTWNQQFSANTVQTKFKPLREIVSPVSDYIEILDADNGVIGVGAAAANTTVTFIYKYVTDFGSRKPEDYVLNLTPDGSELLYAYMMPIPGEPSPDSVAHLDDTPKTFARTKMTSEYQLIRGRIDLVPIPLALPMGDDILAAVVAAVEKVRPCGIEVNITEPSVQFLNVEIIIEIVAGADIDPTTLQVPIEKSITNYINGLDMGAPAYVERIVAAANLQLSGLKVARVLSPRQDIVPAARTFLRAGEITFR